METVLIDGSTGEGGGQILRTSLALSCITGKRLHIENIRAARRNPGLAKQHLSSVQAACQISNGKCQGVAQGSRVLDFQPGQGEALDWVKPAFGGVRSGDFYFDIGSAGSASLVIQTVLPALFLADKASTVTVTGGTHNPMAPPFDFLRETFLPAITTAGFHGNCKLIKHGFFPAGGGKITFGIQPWEKQPNQVINLCKPAKELQIHARIYTAKLPAHIAQRQQKLLLQSKLAETKHKIALLHSPLDIRNVEHIELTDSDGPGNCVMIWLCEGPWQNGSADSGRTTVFTAFGMRGKPSQNVISEVVDLADDFLVSGAAIDYFLADQILIYMAMAKGGCYSTNRISAHLQTNMEIIKKFLPVDFIIERQGKSFRVSCQPL